MPLDGFQAVAGTCWIETASRPQKWAYGVLVNLYQAYEQESHRFANSSQCLSSDALKLLAVAFAASLRAKTTMSLLLMICCCRKLSLTVRFIRFLSTAFLMDFFAMAKPSLD